MLREITIILLMIMHIMSRLMHMVSLFYELKPEIQVVMAVILHIMVQLLIILLMPLIYGPTVLPRPQTGQVSITTGLT